MRRPDDVDAPPPPSGAVATRSGGASPRRQLLAGEPSLIWRRPPGASVVPTGKVSGRSRQRDRKQRPGPDGELVDAEEPQRKPRPWEGVAMARLGELRAFVQFQTTRGFKLTDPAPVLHVIANALYALRELEPYRLNPGWLRRYLPADCRVEQSFLYEAVSTASGSWLSADDAGRLVGLDLATLLAMIEQGVLLSKLNPFDETPEEREARRADRAKDGNRRRQARYRERRRQLQNGTCAVTPHTHTDRLDRYARHVSNAIVATVASGATTVAEIAAALGKPEVSTRKAVTRAAAEGLIARVSRGRYASSPTDPECAGGGMPPLPATDSEE